MLAARMLGLLLLLLFWLQLRAPCCKADYLSDFFPKLIHWNTREFPMFDSTNEDSSYWIIVVCRMDMEVEFWLEPKVGRPKTRRLGREDGEWNVQLRRSEGPWRVKYNVTLNNMTYKFEYSLFRRLKGLFSKLMVDSTMEVGSMVGIYSLTPNKPLSEPLLHCIRRTAFLSPWKYLEIRYGRSGLGEYMVLPEADFRRVQFLDKFDTPPDKSTPTSTYIRLDTPFPVGLFCASPPPPPLPVPPCTLPVSINEQQPSRYHHHQQQQQQVQPESHDHQQQVQPQLQQQIPYSHEYQQQQQHQQLLLLEPVPVPHHPEPLDHRQKHVRTNDRRNCNPFMPDKCCVSAFVPVGVSATSPTPFMSHHPVYSQQPQSHFNSMGTHNVATSNHPPTPIYGGRVFTPRILFTESYNNAQNSDAFDKPFSDISATYDAALHINQRETESEQDTQTAQSYIPYFPPQSRTSIVTHSPMPTATGYLPTESQVQATSHFDTRQLSPDGNPQYNNKVDESWIDPRGGHLHRFQVHRGSSSRGH